MSKGGTPTIPKDYTFKIGSDGSTIHVDSDLDNIHIKEIAPVTVNSNLAVTQPIVTDSNSKSDSNAKIDLTLEPLKVDSNSNSTIDLKPIAVDSCQTIKIAPLPPIRIEQPYSQHFGFTYMGIELFGFTTSGRYDTLLNSPSHSAPCDCHSHGEHHQSSEPQPATPVKPTTGGLRVRINSK